MSQWIDIDGVGLLCDPCQERGPPHAEYLGKILRDKLRGDSAVFHGIAVLFQERSAQVADTQKPAEKRPQSLGLLSMFLDVFDFYLLLFHSHSSCSKSSAPHSAFASARLMALRRLVAGRALDFEQEL